MNDMVKRDDENDGEDNWRTKVLIIGVVVGAAVGAGAAYLYLQRSDNPNAKPNFTTGDGMRLGLLLLGLLRSVAELGNENK